VAAALAVEVGAASVPEALVATAVPVAVRAWTVYRTGAEELKA
jgi:hypothetical protein